MKETRWRNGPIRWIKRLATEKAIYGTRRTEYPHYDVEYSLSKLFDRELDLARNISLVLSDLSFRYDYTINNLFNALDGYSLGYLKQEEYYNIIIIINYFINFLASENSSLEIIYMLLIVT